MRCIDCRDCWLLVILAAPGMNHELSLIIACPSRLLLVESGSPFGVSPDTSATGTDSSSEAQWHHRRIRTRSGHGAQDKEKH